MLYRTAEDNIIFISYFIDYRKYIRLKLLQRQLTTRLVAVCQATHTRSDTEDVVVGGVHTDLGGVGVLNSGVGKNELKSSVVDTGEVAAARWLVFLRAKGEGVHVDTSVGAAGVGLVGLDKVEVATLTLREAVLAVKLELTGDHWVLTPAV